MALNHSAYPVSGIEPADSDAVPAAEEEWIDVARRLDIPVVGEPPGRDLGVDALRGLAILLVVLGHAISNAVNMNTVSGYNPFYYVNSFIYTFHMPLFFMVSGYVIFGRRIRVGERSIKLLVPFLAWIPVYWFVNRYFRHFPWPVLFWPTLKRTIVEPGDGLWFLEVLFLCTLLLIPVVQLEKWRSWAAELSLVLIFVGVNLIPYQKFGLHSVKYFFFFVAAGYLTSKYRMKINKIGKKWTSVLVLGCSTLFLVSFTVLYYCGKINPFVFPISLPDLFRDPSAYIIRYSTALLGVVFSIGVVVAFRKIQAGTALCWLGLVTMDIYVAHLIMLQVTAGSGWPKVLISCVTGVVLPLALSFLVLRRSRVTAMLFLGIEPGKINVPFRSKPADTGK
ncbi:MAG: acyltransferase [Actinobacteria bacterium]|nr:acyltransferase [Actinomycetota bacterium]